MRLTWPVRELVNAFGSSLPSIVCAHGWEGAWVRHVTPWNTRSAAPRLLTLLRTLSPRRALIPGCGAPAWDAIACARHGWTTTGLDVSSTAINISKSHQAANPELRALPLDFVAADFFTYVPRERFDLIFDYTFLSTLPPTLWRAWATAMRALLTRDGELAVILFPVDQHHGGPPFAVDPDHVHSLLVESGMELVADIEKVPDALSHPARAVSESTGWYTLCAL